MMCNDVFRLPRPQPKLWLMVALVFGAAMPAEALAQGYGEQRTLPFRIHGYDRTTQEVDRRQFSSQAATNSAAGGSSAASGSNSSLLPQKQQSGSSMNNVTLNGNGSTVDTRGVLNAGQDSAGTSQLLNNQSDGASGGANSLPRTIQ